MSEIAGQSANCLSAWRAKEGMARRTDYAMGDIK